MKRIIIVILSLFIFNLTVYAEVIEYVYSDWIDYYPEGIDEIRIETQDRYRWYKIENEERVETEEYYDDLEGYEKIEESKKTYYRVINSEYIYLNAEGYLIKDLSRCRKTFCYQIKIEPFVPNEDNEEEEEEVIEEKPPQEEVIINPDTYDPIYVYYSMLFLCFLIIILINHRKIYLVMSNRWK